MYLYLYHIQQLPYILLLCASCDLRNFNKNKQKYLKSIKPAKNTKKYTKNKKYKSVWAFITLGFWTWGRYGHMDMGVSSSRSSLADSPSITITSWPMEWNGMVNCFLLSNFMANICRLWPRSRVGDPAEMHLGSGVSRQPQPRLQLKSYNFIFIFICSRLAFASSAGFTFLYNLIRMCFFG